jgi:hypothetical protein
MRCGFTTALWRLSLPAPGTDRQSPKASRRIHALEERQRQEREAVREAEEEGDVEVPRGADRELAGRLVARRQEVVFLQLPIELQLGGTTAQKKAAGRKGGKATARKK